MDNPERTKRLLSQGGVTIPTFSWDFPEYRTPREYSAKQIKSGIQKPTKKGFYMDYMLKISKEIPSAQHYKTVDTWSVPKKSRVKLDLKSKKMTYIDQIELEFKRKKATPGIGIYKLMPSKKEIEGKNNKLRIMSAKITQPPKRYFYEDTEFISSKVPGPGNYNPHQAQGRSLSNNKTTTKFWIAKHSEEFKINRKRNKSKPDPALYKPTIYGTFDHFKQTHPVSKKSSSKSFGSTIRFRHYQKSQPSKNPNEQKRPEAATYDLTLEWKGKLSGRKSNDKKKDWYHSISRPNTANVYH